MRQSICLSVTAEIYWISSMNIFYIIVTLHAFSHWDVKIPPPDQLWLNDAAGLSEYLLIKQAHHCLAHVILYNLRPSRQSRNRCIRSKISGYNLDCGWVELGADVMPTRSRWASNNYITRCDRQVQLVGDKML